MAGYDGNGVFTRSHTWVSDAEAGIDIEPGLHDFEDDLFVEGFNKAFCRDGQAAATADWLMDGHRIGGLGSAVSNDQAVNLGQLTGAGATPTPPLKKSLGLDGTNLDGRVNFMAMTGVQGIGWKGADLSWLAKLAKENQTPNRLVMNDTFVGSEADGDPVGNDVFVIDELGNINVSGSITANLSFEGGKWRTITAGKGTRLVVSASGSVQAYSNDTDTTADFAEATMRVFFNAFNTTGSAGLALYKSASGKAAYLESFCGTEPRWLMYLGDTTAETGAAGVYTGSNFQLQACDNNGGTARPYIHIDRNTRDVNFYGDVYSASQFNAKSTTCILSALSGGSVYLRPNGPTSASEQAYLSTAGDFVISGTVGTTVVGGMFAGYGLREKSGMTGNFGADWMNFAYGGSNVLSVYVNNVAFGITMTPCDYRIKQDVQDLISTWEQVRALRPVSYQLTNYEAIKADGMQRWGFIAHETQEVLETMATGVQDGDKIQTLDLVPVVAALTRALQEAMQRIEALEADRK